MANTKISQLNLAGDEIFSSDLMELSRDDGAGGYTSEAISGDQLYEGGMKMNPYLLASYDFTQLFVANVAKAVDFRNIDLQDFIDVITNTQLTFDKFGKYQINFTATIWNDGGGSPSGFYVGFFLKKNGTTNIANSSTFFTAPHNNDIDSYSTSWLVDIKGGDYIEVYCEMNKANFKLETESTHTGVTTPSSKVNISRIG